MARADLRAIGLWIAGRGAPLTAVAYVRRIRRQVETYSKAPERGAPRDDVLPGLRIGVFERRVVIAYSVEADAVSILRLFYGGQDWEGELMGRPDPGEDDLED
jgi:toxin ParE1/3/4